MKDNERRRTIFLLAGAWLCKPIPFEEVLKNSKLKENIFCRAGSQSFDKNSISPSFHKISKTIFIQSTDFV